MKMSVCNSECAITMERKETGGVAEGNLDFTDDVLLNLQVKTQQKITSTLNANADGYYIS